MPKKRTYKNKGLKKGYVINWNARIVYKKKKMPKKGKNVKPY